MENIEFWKLVAGNSTVFLILGGIIMYLMKKLEKKENENVAIQQELRAVEKETVKVLSDLNKGLESLIDTNDSNTDRVLDNIQHLREMIIDKLTK